VEKTKESFAITTSLAIPATGSEKDRVIISGGFDYISKAFPSAGRSLPIYGHLF
jgi:hypothetical protein